MITRRVIASGLFIAALTTSGLVLPRGAAAADPPARLQTGAEEREDGSWMLTATVTRGGVVQSQQTVEFLQIVDFFGTRLVPLGSGVTDAAGVASRLYKPTSNGLQRIVARYSGGGETAESDLFEIEVTGAAPLLPGEGPVLPIIQSAAFPVGFGILILVWLALATILFRAILGIARPAVGQAPDGIPEAWRARGPGFHENR